MRIPFSEDTSIHATGISEHLPPADCLPDASDAQERRRELALMELTCTFYIRLGNGKCLFPKGELFCDG